MSVDKTTSKEALEPCPKCRDCWALYRSGKDDEEVTCGRCGFNAPYATWQSRYPIPVRYLSELGDSRVSAPIVPVVDEAGKTDEGEEIVPSGFRDLSTTWLCMAIDYQKAANRFLDHGERERSVIENAKAEMLAWCRREMIAVAKRY